MTDYNKYIRSASFRGVPFEVREDAKTGGRRNEVHEYPGGDRPMTEDLGRKSRTFQIQGFVIGDDWQKKEQALIDALEKKGPGELVHPNGKTYIVNVDSYNCAGSIAMFESRFEITCLESGEQPSPMAGASLSDRMILAARTLDITNAAEFINKIVSVPANAIADVANIAQSIVSNFRGIVGGVQDVADTITGAMDSIVSVATELSDLKNDAEILMRTPDVWTARVKAATDIVSALVPHTPKSVSDTLNASRDGTDFNKVSPQEFGYAEMRAARNYNTAKAATSAVEVLQYVRISSPSDAQSILDNFSVKMDGILESDIPMSPEFTIAVSDFKAAVARFCNEIIRNLPMEMTIKNQSVLPAVVVAHNLYGDARRAAEICAHNDIKNPTFVPAGIELNILAK